MAPPVTITITAGTHKRTPLPAASTSATVVAAIPTIASTTVGTLRRRWWWIDSTMVSTTGSSIPVPSRIERKVAHCRLRSSPTTVSYTHLRAHETVLDLVCRLLLE